MHRAASLSCPLSGAGEPHLGPPDRPSKILLVQVGTLSSSHPSFGVSVFFLSLHWARDWRALALTQEQVHQKNFTTKLPRAPKNLLFASRIAGTAITSLDPLGLPSPTASPARHDPHPDHSQRSKRSTRARCHLRCPVFFCSRMQSLPRVNLCLRRKPVQSLTVSTFTTRA